MDVRLPDGTIVTNVPDNITKEELMSRLRHPTPSQRRGADPDQRLRSLNYGGQDRALAGSVARGALDTIGGGAQLLSRGASGLGLVPESTGNQFLAGPAEVENQNTAAHAALDERYGPAAPGFDVARVGTSALLTLPMVPSKFLQAPTLVQRSLGGGAAGGIAGSMQEVRNPTDAKDYWTQKAGQTGAGFGAGVVAQPIAEAVVKTVVGGINKLAEKGAAAARNLSGANSLENIERLTQEALGRSGIDYAGLSEATKKALLGDVQKALGQFSGTNPGAVARQAAFREEGLDPLRHWVTRDPAEYTWFENLSGVQGVGDALKQRKADLDKLALDRLNQMRGEPTTPVDAGRAGYGDLSNHLSQERGKTNVLYDTFRDIAPDAKGNPQRFVSDVFGGLEGQMAGASLPAGLREIVNKVSKGEIPLTPSTLYQLQKMANASRGSDGSVNFSIGHLSRAIDRELGAISVPQGSQAGDVLRMARGQHAKVQGELEDSKLLRQADAGAEPESFTDNLLKGSVRDLASSWVKLSNESKGLVRAQVVDELKRKVFSGASDEAGKTAAQASFNAFINDPTNKQKLTVVLGSSGYQRAKRLGVMLESAHMAPSGSKVNTSNTAPSLLSFGTRMGDGMVAKGIPGGRMAQDTFRRGAVENALVPSPGALGTESLLIDPLQLELLKRRAGYATGLLGGVSAYPGLMGVFAPEPAR